MILFTDPALPTKHRPDLPAGLEAVILKCLRRERSERYADVLELAEALRPFASAEGAHRIQAVKQAFATTDPERVAERAARAASADDGEPKTAADIGATLQVTTPEAKRKRADITAPAAAIATSPTSTPATKVSGPAVNESVATSMTSSKASIVYPPSATPPRRTLPFVVGGVAALGLGGALLFAKLAATHSAPPVAATGIVVPTAAMPESAAITETTPPLGASNLPPPIVALPSAVPSSIAPAASFLAPASSVARVPLSAHSASRPTVLRPAPHAGPSAQPDLLLDRK